MNVNAEPDVLNDEISFDERQKELEAKEKAEKNKKKSKFRDFTQWNNKVYELEEKIMKKSSIAYRIFKFLVFHMDKYNGVVVSYQTIGEFLDISKASVYRGVKLLKDNSFIDVYKSGNTNVYAVNHNIAWKNSGDRVKYSKFKANVILGYNEQEKEIQKKITEYRHKEIEIKE